MIQLLVESLDLKIVNYVEDCYASESYGTIYAFDKNYSTEEAIGALDYTVEETKKIFYIRMIEVAKDYRGQGVAEAMCKFAKNEYEGYEPDFGLTTADGDKLKNRVTKVEHNDLYNHIVNEIKKRQVMMDELQQKSEQLFDDADEKGEDALEQLRQSSILDEIGDEWEKLSTEVHKLQKGLSVMQADRLVWTI